MTSTIANCAGIGQGDKGLECWNCQSGYQIDYMSWTKCKRICTDSYCMDC